MKRYSARDDFREWDYLLVQDRINGGISAVKASALAKLPALKGEKGDAGERGNNGAAGAQGPQGPAGPTGPRGNNGSNGANGLSGDGAIVGTVAPTPATGVSVLWVDTTGGNVTLNLVTGD